MKSKRHNIEVYVTAANKDAQVNITERDTHRQDKKNDLSKRARATFDGTEVSLTIIPLFYCILVNFYFTILDTQYTRASSQKEKCGCLTFRVDKGGIQKVSLFYFGLVWFVILFYFICFVLFCLVLFCFVLVCFVLLCFVLFIFFVFFF